MRVTRVIGVLAAAAISAACTIPQGTVFNTSDQNNAVITTTDARQRVIINHNPNDFSRPGLITPIQIICTEPSPDVALAVANSFGAGLSVLTQGSGSISAQQSQAILQLAERTATLQILREQLFRACEAYSNGAITGTTYSLMLSKLYHTIATLALGDTAGGNFGRSLGVAGAQGSAEANAAMAGFASAVNDAKDAAQKLAAAEEKVMQATEAVAKQEKISNAATEEPGKTTEKEKLDAARADLAKATGERDALKEILKGRLDTASKAGGSISGLTAAGGLQKAPSVEVARVLSEMLSGFLNSDESQSVIAACLVELGMRPDDSTQDVLILDRAIDAMFAARTAGETEAGPPALKRPPNLLARTASLTRRTGLYRHCNDYLNEYVRAARDADTRIKLASVELNRRQLDVRKLELTASKAQKISEALALCAKIEIKPLQDQCLKMISDPEGAERGVDARVSAFQETRSDRPEQEIRPIESWLALDKSRSKLTALMAELTKATVPAANADTAKRRRDLLLEQKARYTKAATDRNAAADQVVKDWPRNKVLELQNERYDQLSLLEAAKTPIELAKAQSALANQAGRVKSLVQILEVTRKELDISSNDIETFLPQIRVAARE